MVESTGNKILFKVGTGRVYPFPVRFIDASDVHCFVNVNGVERELVASEFSVERKDDYSDGANVTLNIDPLPTGATLAIVRQCDPVQLVSFPINGKFPSKGNENALDKLTMIAQDLYERLNRAIAGSVTDYVTPEELLKSIFEASVSAQKSSRDAAESAGVAQESADKIADNLQKSIGLQIGTIFAFPSMVPPKGAYLLNGQTITNCSTLYPKFYEWVQSAGVRIVDNATFEAELASAGVCGGFVVDTSAGSVRLPSVTQGTLWGADSATIGQSLAAGLRYSAGDSPEYGNSDTVQPPAIRVSWCIQVFNAATDLSEQQSAQLASEMQTKAQTDLANVNSAGKSFILAQMAYDFDNMKVGLTASTVYQADTAGILRATVQPAEANAQAVLSIQVAKKSDDFTEALISSAFSRYGDSSTGAGANLFVPKGYFYRAVIQKAKNESFTMRFIPLKGDTE